MIRPSLFRAHTKYRWFVSLEDWLFPTYRSHSKLSREQLKTQASHHLINNHTHMKAAFKQEVISVTTKYNQDKGKSDDHNIL